MSKVKLIFGCRKQKLSDAYMKALIRNGELKQRIADLEEQLRWIPVSEKLPDVLTTVVVINKKYKLLADVVGKKGDVHLRDNNYEIYDFNQFTHWCHITPPKL